jgi:glycosyltransferase involved in cell wall biosynthesis
MRVAIVSCVYPPEPVASALISQDLTVGLLAAGAEVNVICPIPSRPYGSHYSVSLPQNICNAEVTRVQSFTAPQSHFLPRLRESYSFGRHACSHLARVGEKLDVVYANTWPLLSQAYVARFCSSMGLPLVLHVQDIYPESGLTKMSSPLRGLLALPLLALDRWTARRSTRLVCISDGMRKSYAASRGISTSKVEVIPNWTDEARFSISLNRVSACAQFGLSPAPFTFLYVGTINHTANVELLIESFRLANLPGAQLVIAGDGSTRSDCVRYVRAHDLSHVHFLSGITAENTPLVQSIGHVCLLPLRRGVGVNAMPSKLMAYMFSAKPILATVDADSDTARAILSSGGGWVGSPEDAEWLANKMRDVAAMPESLITAMGDKGRTYGLGHFSKAVGVRRLVDVIKSAAQTQ